VRIEAHEPVWAIADSRTLGEAVLALAGAASSSAGCSRLSLACDRTAVAQQIPGATLAPGPYARITVQGDGPGFDAERSARLFESILPQGTGEGSGAALAEAYGLVREWGGDIAYAGDASHSTFVVYLRLAEPRKPEPQKAAPVETPALQPLVMVVDDEPGIRVLVARILRREGYEVIEASSAAEAATLAAAQRRPMDLLVTDVMLSDRRGSELARQLREELPRLRVLYISGYAGGESARTVEFPPGAKFLQKPFTLAALVATVRETLEPG
jgi:two-component system, cell cycle sensor histidine kinase and response regulator CckA